MPQPREMTHPRTKVVLQSRQFSASSSPAPQILRVLKLRYKVASSQLPAPQIAPHTKVVLQSHRFSSSSSPDTPRTKVVLQSRQFSASSSTGFSAYSKLYYKVASSQLPAPQIALRTKKTTKSPVLSFQLHRLLRVLKLYYKVASSQLPAPQIAPRTKVAPDRAKTHSRLHFAPSTRTISAEGCPRQIQNALSPAFRAFDTHDLCRGLLASRTNRARACVSRTPHARSPQRVAPDRVKTHSRLRFVPSTRTISAEGQNALSPAFRALDTQDLRRGSELPSKHCSSVAELCVPSNSLTNLYFALVSFAVTP